MCYRVEWLSPAFLGVWGSTTSIESSSIEVVLGIRYWVLV